MSETIECPACMRQFRWKPELAGKRAKCKCGGRVTFPLEAPAPVAASRTATLAVEGSGDEALAALAELSTREQTAGAPPVQLGYDFCPHCNHRLEPGAVLCMKCGYNAKTGRTLSTKIKTGPDASEAALATTVVAARVVLSLVVGGVVAVLGAVGWIAVIILTGYQIGILASLLGLLVGGSMRLCNPRGGDMPALAAGAFAFLSLAIAKGFLVVVALRAEIPVSEVLHPLDFLWFFLAISAAYKLARG